MVTVLAGLAAGLMTIGQSYALSATIARVFIGKASLAQVWPWMQALLALAAGRAALVWVNEVAAKSVAVRIKTRLRTTLFAHILRLGPAYTRGERTGELTAAAVDGIEALDAYFSQYLPQLVISTLVPISVLVLVFPLDPLSGIVLLLTAPLIPFFMYMIGRGAEVVTKQQYETLSRLSAHFLDSLQGLTTLKLFGQSKAQARNIEAVSNQYRDTTLKVLQVTFLSAFALELLATISTAIIAVEVGLRLLYAQMQFQQALFLLILAPEFYLPLRMLGLRFHAGMSGTSAARRIFQILDIRAPSAEVHTPATAAGIAAGAKDRWLGADGKVELRLQHVTYTYPDATEPAVRDVSFRIRSGQHVALVGASGAGKTTLAEILLRFMEPASGTIVLNGRPLHQLPGDDWRAITAWVPQNAHLFHTSIAANIRLANPNASDEEVAAAARAAHLEEFILSLPERYETVVGEAGARLSSGQAQRITLARAFLKNPRILIMDEPTSSLDPETEALLEASTRALMQGRTVITIAHRLNTAAKADQIIVMQAGGVAEIGTHRELLQRGGIYARIVKSQTSERHESIPEHHSIGTEPEKQAPAEQERPPLGLAPEATASDTAHYSIFRRLLTFLAGSWGSVALSVLLSSLTIGASVALMGTSSWLISMAALHPSIAALEVAIVGVRFFGIVRAVFRYLERLVSHNVTFRLLGRLRVWFYESLEPLAPARLMGYRAGDLQARIIGDVNALENFYVRVLAPPATAFVVCAGTSVFLWLSDPRLAVILIGCFLLVGAALPAVVMQVTWRMGSEEIAQRSELQVQLVDGIQGIADLLAFGRGPERISQIRAKGLEYGSTQLRLARVNGAQAAAYTFLTNFAPWLVLWIAIPQVASGRISGVMLAPLILLTSASFEAVAPLPLAAYAWSGVRAAAKRLFDIVDAEPEVSENPALGSTASPKRTPTTRLEFCGVSFRYPGQNGQALEDVSFCLEQGKRLAIVGASGAGKSTVASLLLRFWNFDGGKILLDGRPVEDYAPDEVRENVALISPNTYLFNTSVFENIRMARRRVTREDVEGAARAAQIHDFIVKLPKGYDTLVGEQGFRLSGGERQRLAVARAILKDSPIFILDEPTAHLDAITEAQVLASLFELTRHKASLLITHRLIGLDQMDEVLVLDHGRIAQRGLQADLLDREGPYRRLWTLQNRFLTDR